MEGNVTAGQTAGVVPMRLQEVVRTGDGVAGTAASSKMEARNVDFYYGATQALKSINASLKERRITALIGPSGCGKSTFLRNLNRMNELIPNTRITGQITLDGQDIYARDIDVVSIRQR